MPHKRQQKQLMPHRWNKKLETCSNKKKRRRKRKKKKKSLKEAQQCGCVGLSSVNA